MNKLFSYLKKLLPKETPHQPRQHFILGIDPDEVTDEVLQEMREILEKRKREFPEHEE